jgi:hypothetical protein
MEREEAAWRLQRFLRRCHQRSKPRIAPSSPAEYLRIEAALVIQRCYRGHRVRRKWIASDARPAALFLQRTCRGFVARCWCFSASQANERRFRDPDEMSWDDNVRTNDGVFVPVGYRAAADANEFILRLKAVQSRTSENAANAIQRWWRQTYSNSLVLDHKRTISRLLHLNSQAVIIQLWWRKKMKKRLGAQSPSRVGGRLERPPATQHRDHRAQMMTHGIIASERGAQRRAAHSQLLTIWNSATNRAGTTDSAVLPPLRTSAKKHQGPAKSLAPRVDAPHGRYGAYSNNGRQIWNSATTKDAPTWYAGQHDASVYQRPTSTFM